jgi:chaperonin cofactor prefoldin
MTQAQVPDWGMIGVVVGFVAQFGVLLGVFFRQGRFEGTIATKIESIERRQTELENTKLKDLEERVVDQFDSRIEAFDRLMSVHVNQIQQEIATLRDWKHELASQISSVRRVSGEGESLDPFPRRSNRP